MPQSSLSYSCAKVGPAAVPWKVTVCDIGWARLPSLTPPLLPTRSQSPSKNVQQEQIG